MQFLPRLSVVVSILSYASVIMVRQQTLAIVAAIAAGVESPSGAGVEVYLAAGVATTEDDRQYDTEYRDDSRPEDYTEDNAGGAILIFFLDELRQLGFVAVKEVDIDVICGIGGGSVGISTTRGGHIRAADDEIILGGLALRRCGDNDFALLETDYLNAGVAYFLDRDDGGVRAVEHGVDGAGHILYGEIERCRLAHLDALAVGGLEGDGAKTVLRALRDDQRCGGSGFGGLAGGSRRGSCRSFLGRRGSRCSGGSSL